MLSDSRLLTGAATYVADLDDPLLANCARAVFVRSQVAHATFTVDLTEARLGEGVIGVFSAEDISAWPTTAYSAQLSARFAQPLLAEHKVRFVGEPVAVVVAESLAQALDAAEYVVVDYEPLPAVLTVAQSVRDEVEVFGDGDLATRNSAGRDLPTGERTNVVTSATAGGLDTTHQPERFEGAQIVVRETFVNPRQLAAPIECRGAAAVWTPNGDLHVWLSTQTPHSFRGRISPIYGLALSSIHVIAGPTVGGGFGGKGAPGPEEQLVPELARLVGRPVQWIESRSENLTSAPQGRAEELDITLAGTSDGDLQAVRVELRKEAGAYPSSGAGLPNAWSRAVANGVYDIGHVEFDAVVAITNKPPVSALRGAGRSPIIAALERCIDMYAARCGLDPVELRRRNLVQPTDMPWRSPTGAIYDEADYPAALDAAVRLADYESLRAEQRRRRDARESLQMGIGVASYVHRTNGGSSEQAIVKITADGGATIVTGTTDQGQMHASTWATIASNELGISPELITVIEGVTDEIATGIGAIGSRSVQTAGMAVQVASVDVVNQALGLAADHLEAAEADIVLDRAVGAFHVIGSPARSVGWAELASFGLAHSRELACDNTYDPDGLDVYPSGCHIAVVDVDISTGEVLLKRFVAVDDAGVQVNPASVTAQLHGGIALGVAQVLGEVSEFDDDANPLNGTLLDYPIITIDQLCQFELETHETATSVNPRGWKAVGESGPIGATPALHNAVIDAVAHLGIEHIDLPCTAQRVWRAIEDAQ